MRFKPIRRIVPGTSHPYWIKHKKDIWDKLRVGEEVDIDIDEYFKIGTFKLPPIPVDADTEKPTWTEEGWALAKFLELNAFLKFIPPDQESKSPKGLAAKQTKDKEN